MAEPVLEEYIIFYPPSRTNKEMKADVDEVSWDQTDNEFKNWIEANIFDYESPGYKDDWIYEWDDKAPWVNEKPWKIDGVWKEPTGVKHRSLEESDLKDKALRNKAALEESMNQDDKSSNDAWNNYSPIDEWCDQGDATNMEPNVNYNTYLDIGRLFNDHTTKNESKDVQDENEDVGDLDDYLVRGDAQFNKDDERMYKLRRIPYAKSSACKTKRFEVVKYSFGPSERTLLSKNVG
uniref:Uncharacterized protein n=1 Tax=Tanacetum cinerariifolium TaxID=118510 RepID=A0A6L2MQ40_TANCI|nr:hypothetical protein [Tanacetum cinerariifolium]